MSRTGKESTGVRGGQRERERAGEGERERASKRKRGGEGWGVCVRKSERVRQVSEVRRIINKFQYIALLHSLNKCANDTSHLHNAHALSLVATLAGRNYLIQKI